MGIPVYTNITLDMTRPNGAVMWAKQNDRLSRKVVAQLTSGGVAWEAPTSSTISAILRYRKPDGTAGFYDTDEAGNPAVVLDGSTATLTLVNQALTVPGVVEYELNFYNNARRLTSFSFKVNVERSAIDDSTIVSSNYFNALTAAIADAQDAIEDATTILTTSHFPNRNLLDNGWFTINQRGVTTLPASDYFVDRWVTYSAAGTVNANGVSLTSGNIYQKLEPDLWTSLIGKPLTASLMLSTGTIRTATITNFGGSDVTFPGGVFSLSAASKAFNVYSTGTIRAVKLEIGIVSTLANDVMPDYTNELLKCQRYFYRLSNPKNSRQNFGFSQIAAGASSIFFAVQLPTSMRHAVATNDGFSPSSQDCIGASLTTGGNAVYSTELSVYSVWADNTKVVIQATFSGLTASAAYAMFMAANSYIDFSAEL